jgi:segregation and condensation protein A
MLATAGRMRPRTVGLDDRYLKLLPEVEINLSPDDFANLAARALEPKLPEVISMAHLHAAKVSVREQAAIIVERLRRLGQATFRQLTVDCDTTLLIVARFLALLEIYRDGNVMFDQPTPLGELYVRWVGSDNEEAIMREIDEFETTVDEFAVEQAQQFRDAADWVTDGD